MVQVAPAGRPLQLIIGCNTIPSSGIKGAGRLTVIVIVVELDEPAVTVMLLGFAERLIVTAVVAGVGAALTGLNKPTTNSKIKTTENSKTLSLTKHVTKYHFPRHTFKTWNFEIGFTAWF